MIHVLEISDGRKVKENRFLAFPDGISVKLLQAVSMKF